MKKKIYEINGISLSNKQMKELKGGNGCPDTCGASGQGSCSYWTDRGCMCSYNGVLASGCSSGNQTV